MQLGHLLTRSGLTYPEVTSKVYYDSFYQSDISVSFPWVMYFDAFYLHVVSTISCIPVIPVPNYWYITDNENTGVQVETLVTVLLCSTLSKQNYHTCN